MTRSDAVTFPSEGAELRGVLHLPHGPTAAGPAPGVVVTGSWTTVKEQMAGRYARRLAEEGFATVAFDHRGFGESGGYPRDLESPAVKAADIHAAVTFLADHPDVDGDRLGALGVCASAGYTVLNAAGDARVRSIALVAPWLHDADLVRGLYGGEEGVAARITAGARARRRFTETGEVDYVDAVATAAADDPGASAAMVGPFDSPPWDYYTDPGRGAVPQWSNRFAVMQWEEWLTFDPIAVAPSITQPVLLVHSEDAAVPDGAKAFASGLAGEHRFVWTEGVQLDFYDQQAQVTRAVREVAAHLRTTL
jgi:hypothetical protein